MSNMVSLLSFDSKSMKILLGNDDYDSTFPMIYKNKIPKLSKPGKYYVKNPIETALDNN